VIRLRCFCIADHGKLLWCSGSVHCLGAWSWSQGSSTPSCPASPMSGLQGQPGEQVTLEKISQGLHRVEVGRGQSVSVDPIASVSRLLDVVTRTRRQKHASANQKHCPTLLSHPLSIFLFKKRQAPALQPRRMLLDFALELPGLFSPTVSNV